MSRYSDTSVTSAQSMEMASADRALGPWALPAPSEQHVYGMGNLIFVRSLAHA